MVFYRHLFVLGNKLLIITPPISTLSTRLEGCGFEPRLGGPSRRLVKCLSIIFSGAFHLLGMIDLVESIGLNHDFTVTGRYLLSLHNNLVSIHRDTCIA